MPLNRWEEKNKIGKGIQNCSLFLTLLEAARTTGIAVEPFMRGCMLTALMQRQKRGLALMQKEFLFHELGIQNSTPLL